MRPLGFLRKLVSPPAFPDEEKTLTALILSNVIWCLVAVLAAAAAIGLPFVFTRKAESAAVLAAFFLVLLAALALLRGGRVTLAARLLTVFLWLVFAALAAISGGITSVNLIFLLSVSVQAGLTCGPGWSIGVAAASCLFTLALAVMESAGLPPPRIFPTPPFARWLMISLGTATTMISLVLGLRNRIKAIASAREELRVRLEAESALKRSEERFRAIFDSVSEAVFLHSVDGPILDVNRKVTELYGRTLEDFVSGVRTEDMSDVEGGFTQEKADALLARAASGESITYEWRAKHRDGTFFWVEARMRRADIAGEPRILVTARDIDDRIRAREERHRLEEGLRQAQKMESIGRLAGGVAHDFNNLLTGIIGNLELALMREIAPETRSGIDEAMRAAGRAAELTRHLLALSRKQIIEPETLDLRDLIESMRGMLSRLLGERIELATSCPEAPCAVFVDPSQIEHMILNLAINARDAMPSGGRLNLSLQNERIGEGFREPPGEYALLSVVDTGLGMEPDVLMHAFEPFFTTKARGKGTGLGLSIVFGIVTQNQGFIDAESAPGNGSTFRIRFPRLMGSAPSPATIRDPGSVARGRESILLVEDEEVVRKMVERSLAISGYQVSPFESAEAALAALPGLGKIDLLVTDVILTGMDGREMARIMEKAIPGLLVLYVSGYPNEVIADRGILQKGIQFLAKPFGPAELAAKVRSVLDSFPGKGA
jgi:two-component system cell cycle sensor histidine kinase/response regulator CckA